MSDLHLEFHRQMDFGIAFTGENVLVLAGDIQAGYNVTAWMSELLKERDVVYVMGNHEFYHQDMPNMLKELQTFAADVNARARAKGYNFSFYALENERVDLYGHRFIGATLWTDYANADPHHMDHSESCMNDYRIINNGGKRLRATDLLAKHKESLTYIKDAIAQTTLPVVVVTHHAPSFQSVHVQYAGDLLNSSFASNLDDVARTVPLWIHGHMHQVADYTLDPTNKMGRVVCNPRGYVSMGETNEFNQDLVIEL